MMATLDFQHHQSLVSHDPSEIYSNQETFLIIISSKTLFFQDSLMNRYQKNSF